MKRCIAISLSIIIVLLSALNVSAYEYNDMNYDIFYQNPDWTSGASNIDKYIRFTGQSFVGSDYINVAETSLIGYSLSPLVPYYADGDHVSIFLSFGISIPRVNFQGTNNTWGGEYRIMLSPSGYRTTLDHTSLLSTTIFDLRELVANNVFSKQIAGSVTWQNVTGSYKALIYHGSDSQKYGTTTDYENFFINIQLDLNLVQGMELLPLSVFCWRVTQSVGYLDSWRLLSRPSFYLNDTSMYGLLGEIKTALDSLDFSALADLSQLSSIISNIYSSVVYQNELIEDMLEDTEPDEDLTRWAEEQSALASDADALQSIEQSYLDVLNDFTFPEVPNQTATGNVFNRFFEIPLFVSMIVTSMSMMIVLALIARK